MAEKVAEIRVENFRGAPNNTLELKGKSLVLLGENGKGKSTFVDAIEFLFSGQVGRFKGTGTGSIKHDDALRHVRSTAKPRVILQWENSGREIVRSLSEDQVQIIAKSGDKLPDCEVFRQHPEVDAFILRRDKILRFIFDQEADRYRRFVQLLGLKEVDDWQRLFIDTEKRAVADQLQQSQSLKQALGALNRPAINFTIESRDGIFTAASQMVQAWDLPPLSQPEHFDERLKDLRARRTGTNQAKLEKLGLAIACLKSTLPPSLAADLAEFNQGQARRRQLAASSQEAARLQVITQGLAYLQNHPSETDCPLCQQALPQPLSDVLSQLRARSEALQELQQIQARQRQILQAFRNSVQTIAASLANDFRHKEQWEISHCQQYEELLANISDWQEFLTNWSVEANLAEIDLPPFLSTIAPLRVEILNRLSESREKLIAPNQQSLEQAIAWFEQVVEVWPQLQRQGRALQSAQALADRVAKLRSAYSKAREESIQKIFNEIAQTVMKFYRELHDVQEEGEESECSGVTLQATSRALAGGLRLAIDFLGVSKDQDPRAFLSEGHLDSLGLCLFLASAKTFNPPGSLLVLDDVLTSIDKSHRHRVGRLLFQHFSDYQVFLTTHDGLWNKNLDDTCVLMEKRGEWKFDTVHEWSLQAGPTLSPSTDDWDFIDKHLNAKDFKQLGGAFRRQFETFLKDAAQKLGTRVPYRSDGRYAAGAFLSGGLPKELRKKLIICNPAEKAAIDRDCDYVFGVTTLTNCLSHDNPSLHELAFEQIRDFAKGLREVIRRTKKLSASTAGGEE